MVIDYNALLEYSRASGESDNWEKVLKQFPGVQGMAFTELKLDELEGYGICTVYSGIALGADTGQGTGEPPLPNPQYTYLVQWSPHKEVTPEKLVAAINQAFPKADASLWDSSRSSKIKGAKVVEVKMPLRSLQNTGICYPEWAIQEARSKFSIWLRPENKASTIQPADIKAYFDRLQQANDPEGIIFGGSSNEVVGYADEDVLKSSAAAIQAEGWKLGFIESAKLNQQKGIETLVRNSHLNTVRVFTVPPMQQEKLKPERVAQMYSLAARERNLTVLYLRPYAYDPTPDKGFEDANQKFFSDLSSQLQDRLSAKADTFATDIQLHPVVVALLSLAGLAAFWLVVLDYLPKAPNALIGGSLVAFAVVNAALANKHMWMALMALGTACCLSALSVISQFRRLRRAADKPTHLEAMMSSSHAWLVMSLISLAGAWIASCFLQETTYKLGLDVFRGVKMITVLMPVAITALWCLSEDQRKHWLGIGGAPLKLYQLIALGILAVGGLVYTMRTGNMAGTDVGDSMEGERYLRMVLDKTLGVRPRFKEFLMAHPAMLLAPLALRMGWKELTAILILVGATGQCGLFDTFAHVHTPLQVSLIRCVMGAAFGLLLGWIYAGILLGVAKGVGWLQRKVTP